MPSKKFYATQKSKKSTLSMGLKALSSLAVGSSLLLGAFAQADLARDPLAQDSTLNAPKLTESNQALKLTESNQAALELTEANQAFKLTEPNQALELTESNQAFELTEANQALEFTPAKSFIAKNSKSITKNSKSITKNSKNIANNSKNIANLDNRVNNLRGDMNRRFNRVDDRIDAIGAMAMANMAAAANAGNSSCDNWRDCVGSLSMGVGHLGAETAGAVMYTRPLGSSARFSVGATYADNEVGSSLGFGFDL
ncbi:MAG: hypothetical protein K0U59_01415 [Gammaproteobacteria bacterium]|nr:hypothetical protein [Gammaproteobacteria bacterium]